MKKREKAIKLLKNEKDKWGHDLNYRHYLFKRLIKAKRPKEVELVLEAVKGNLTPMEYQREKEKLEANIAVKSCIVPGH